MGLASVCVSAVTTGQLEKEFATPPASARPHVFWYWINGNINREGLTADLEAMQRAGIGGAMIFNIGGHGAAGPVKVLSDDWRDLMQQPLAGRRAIARRRKIQQRRMAPYSGVAKMVDRPQNTTHLRTIRFCDI